MADLEGINRFFERDSGGHGGVARSIQGCASHQVASPTVRRGHGLGHSHQEMDRIVHCGASIGRSG